MMLPTYIQAELACERGTATPLEKFIAYNAPDFDPNVEEHTRQIFWTQLSDLLLWLAKESKQ